MVSEAGSCYELQWATIRSFATNIGCTPERLSRWVGWQEREINHCSGPPPTQEERINALEREVRKLRKANEILR